MSFTTNTEEKFWFEDKLYADWQKIAEWDHGYIKS